VNAPYPGSHVLRFSNAARFAAIINLVATVLWTR
jgi:hypothetical protein